VAKVLGKWEGSRVIGMSRGAIYYIRKRLGGKLYEMSSGPGWAAHSTVVGQRGRRWLRPKGTVLVPC
jgi:hypothetical protein